MPVWRSGGVVSIPVAGPSSATSWVLCRCGLAHISDRPGCCRRPWDGPLGLAVGGGAADRANAVAQVPFSRVSPRLRSDFRLIPAARVAEQALFLTTPR